MRRRARDDADGSSGGCLTLHSVVAQHDRDTSASSMGWAQAQPAKLAGNVYVTGAIFLVDFRRAQCQGRRAKRASIEDFGSFFRRKKRARHFSAAALHYRIIRFPRFLISALFRVDILSYMYFQRDSRRRQFQSRESGIRCGKVGGKGITLLLPLTCLLTVQIHSDDDSSPAGVGNAGRRGSRKYTRATLKAEKA